MPPKGILVDDKLEYKVESICIVQGPLRNREYYVKWRGYSDDKCMWEPHDLIKDTIALEAFL